MVTQRFSKENAALVLVDHQVGILESLVRVPPADVVKSNVTALVRAARVLDMPVVLTSSSEEYQGVLLPELEEIAPEAYAARIRRHGTVNAFDDPGFAAAVKGIGRSNLIMAVSVLRSVECGRPSEPGGRGTTSSSSPMPAAPTPKQVTRSRCAGWRAKASASPRPPCSYPSSPETSPHPRALNSSRSCSRDSRRTQAACTRLPTPRRPSRRTREHSRPIRPAHKSRSMAIPATRRTHIEWRPTPRQRR